MQDSAKYLIHADVTANGVVERSDVVGAIFGQTEGLLGDDLDLRVLQEASKVGHIDVETRSEGGRTFGEVTIASGLDKVETAVLAAALETIDRVGPCRARFEVTDLEDVRTAKRREVVERAQEILGEFESEVMTSEELVEEVRRSARIADVTEYEGLPAGPRVADSDAVIVVEGRSDVVRLLEYGVKNALAVEGTDVPEAAAQLSQERTVTAFLDGDRGGDLILKELTQVGNVDYVAFAPEGRSVEDLARDEVMAALREKVPFEMVADANTPHEHAAATDGSARPAPPDASDAPPRSEPDADGPAPTDDDGGTDDGSDRPADGADAGSAESGHLDESGGSESAADGEPETLAGHVEAVVGRGTATVRLLDSAFRTLATAPADDAFGAVEGAERTPATVVLDGELTQRILDVAAQRGVERIVARSEGEFVKKPAGVRVRTADRILD